MGIRILIADDHQIMRQGLKTLFEKEPGMEVVAEAEDGRRTIHLARELMPHVVIMDPELPDLNGAEACRELLGQLPQLKIVALSNQTDRRFVVSLLKAGVQGYLLLKDCSFENLVRAIRLALANRTYLSPGVAEVVNTSQIDRVVCRFGNSSELTRRELEILQLLSEGKRSAQIARALGISIKTVDTHRQQVMQKLGTKSIAELTKYALRKGLTSLES